MDIKLKCRICKKEFYGQKNKMYCSKDCKNRSRRNIRNEKNKEKRRKETNKKYYLKTKYTLTKKYKIEQEENGKRENEKKKREKEYSKTWTSNNKVKSAEYRRRTRDKNRLWFNEYKKTLKCEVCGYDKCPESLDFHHEDSDKKEFSIGQSLTKYGREIILFEIKKCKVFCANCHREFHFNKKQEEIKKQREEYKKIIYEPKKLYYKIVEEELKKEWFKQLQDKAKYNLNRFGGNQYIKVDNGISEKIDIKKVLAEKIKIGEKRVCRILQIYRRGTEEQKQRARTGESSITKIYKELKPIRYSQRMIK